MELRYLLAKMSHRRAGMEFSLDLAAGRASTIVVLVTLMIVIFSTIYPAEGLNMTPQRAVDGGEMNSASTNNSAALYRGEVAGLWSELTTLSDNLVSRSLEMDRNSSTNISSMELATIIGLSTNSSQQHADDDDKSLIIGIIVANILIFIIGFCGNSLVILVILKFTRIETVTDIYILNLAFADIMFLFGLVFLIITMFIDHWIFGNLMCKLYMATTSLNQFASSLLLVVMSFDRFLAVCHPIYAQRFRRLRRAKVICLCIWITCLVLMTPIFAFAKTNKDLTCAIFWPEYKSFNCEIAFTLYSFAIGFACPLLLIAAFYTCVIRKLRIAASGPINLGSSRRSRSRESTNKRIEHLVIGIICTYTICWLPYWTSQLCVSFTTTFERSPIEGFYPFVLIATCLSYTNSALNPILYAFLSDNFKRRCSDVFRFITSISWCRHRSPATDTHSTVATALCEPSEVNNNNNNNNHSYNHNHNYLRPESRQTVVMNESVRLVTNQNQLADILNNPTTTTTATTNSDLLSNNNGNHNHHTTITTIDNDYAGDQDLKRQQMIGSKLARLHNSLSIDGDYPTVSTNDKHCFPNQGLHHHHRHADCQGDDSAIKEARKGSPDLSAVHGVGGGSVSEPRGARRRSVAFSSVDSIANQGTNISNNQVNKTSDHHQQQQIVKGDHHSMMILQDRKLLHCQEAV